MGGKPRIMPARPAAAPLLVAALLVGSLAPSPVLAQPQTPSEDNMGVMTEDGYRTTDPRAQQSYSQPSFGGAQPNYYATPSGPGGPSGAQVAARRAALPAAKNPLLGKWRSLGGSGPPMAQMPGMGLLGGMASAFGVDANAMSRDIYGSVCANLFGSGIVEFRADSMMINGAANRAAYRGPGGTVQGNEHTVILLPGEAGPTQPAVVLDVVGNKATARGLGCALERVGPGTPGGATGGAPVPGQGTRAPTPGFAGTTGTLDITANVRLPGAARNFSPVPDAPVFVERMSLDESLASVGLRQPSPLRAWLDACTARSAACQQGASAMTASTVAKGKTDADGHVVLPSVPAGHYYVLMVGNAPGQPNQFWDVPIDVKPGSNPVSLNSLNYLVPPN